MFLSWKQTRRLKLHLKLKELGDIDSDAEDNYKYEAGGEVLALSTCLQ